MNLAECLKVRVVVGEIPKRPFKINYISSEWFNNNICGCVGSTLKIKLMLKWFHFHIQTDLCSFIDWLQTVH